MKRFISFLCAGLLSVLLIVPASAAVQGTAIGFIINYNPPDNDHLIAANASYQSEYCYSNHNASFFMHFDSVDGTPFVLFHNGGGTYFAFSKVPTTVRSWRGPIGSSFDDGSTKYESILTVHDGDSWCYSTGSNLFYNNSGYPPFFNTDIPENLQPPLLEIKNPNWSRSQISTALDFFEPPSPQTDKKITIPIGYAAFLKASGTLTMRCTFPSNSALFSGTSGWWGETHQTIGSASALPDASFQFPVADALQIHWGRDTALSPLGILGTTKHAYSEHAAFSPWTVIYNPVYKSVSIGANANDPDSFNGPITVSGTIGEFRLYPLSSGLSSSGIIGDGSSDDFIDVMIYPETGEPVYTDPFGNVVSPPSAGGHTALPEAASNTSLIQRIVGILSDLVNRIEGIFSVAYQAISNLVGLAGPFVSKLSALYSWLPAPVLSALSSAMILAITIGVLKVFL